MRTAILSDVHANLEALRAVLDALAREPVQSIVCLGDCVGYGGDPGDCFDLLLEACDVIVAGNHDRAATGQLDPRRFNDLAKAGAEYSRQALGHARLEALAALPVTAEHDGLLLTHASPCEPDTFPYVRDLRSAYDAFRGAEFDVCVIGHTHVPVTFFHDAVAETVHASVEPFVTWADQRILCNVGSVGQPRDRDPRAAYVIYDADRQVLERHRVEYDCERAAAAIDRAGLPKALGRRLLVGV